MQITEVAWLVNCVQVSAICTVKEMAWKKGKRC